MIKGKMSSLADKIEAKAEEELKNPQKVEEETPVKVEKPIN